MTKDDILKELVNIGEHWDFQHEEILLRNPHDPYNTLRQTSWDSQFQDLILKLRYEAVKLLNK